MDKNQQFTVSDCSGRILFSSVKAFIEQVVNSDNCFICGAVPDSKEFNNEHVIPKWIMRDLTLYNSKITLPNGQLIKYGQYKMKCCKDCNETMGRDFEEPVKALLQQGYNTTINYVNDYGPRITAAMDRPNFSKNPSAYEADENTSGSSSVQRPTRTCSIMGSSASPLLCFTQFLYKLSRRQGGIGVFICISACPRRGRKN